VYRILVGYMCTCHAHWRRLVKNIGWANQNIGGTKGGKSHKCMGVYQRARAAPKVYAYGHATVNRQGLNTYMQEMSSTM